MSVTGIDLGSRTIKIINEKFNHSFMIQYPLRN